MRRPLLLCVLALTGCGDDGSNPFPDDGGTNLEPCASPTGAGTIHTGELTADETWTAADSPHLVTGEVVVRGGRTLTIEECAVVRVSAGRSLYIGSTSASDGTGTLIARGTEAASAGGVSRRVTITSAELTGHWGSLFVERSGNADLSSVLLENGGDPDQFQGGGGTLIGRGDDNRLAPLRNIRARDLYVTGSATYGINLRASAAFTMDSADITITNAGAMGVLSGGEDSHYAMYVETPSIQTLPTSMSFTGSDRNEVLAHAPFIVAVDERFPAIGVPYQMRGSFYMEPAAVGTIQLTIDPGVTIKLGGPLAAAPFMKLGSGETGGNNRAVRLVAAGTAAAPIKLTSGAAAPTAGDWVGINWEGGPATGNVMSYTTVEYGGASAGTNGFGCGPGDNSALVIITDWRPETAFITNSTFGPSAGGGIVSGWASDATGPNLGTGNTFTGISNGCNVSQPESQSGMCPGNDSTPDCF